MRGAFSRIRSLWLGLARRSVVEQEMSEEFAQHIELRARDLERSGMAPTNALIQARREFGLTARYKAEARASRGLHRLDAIRFSWLDVKLGARMMLKYPGLTVVAGLGIAIAIAIGVGYASVFRALLDSSLPLPEGDRIVALQNWDTRHNGRGVTSVRDFVAWRDQLKLVRQVGAYRTVTRNLVSAEGVAEPITLAEMSASGFAAARVQPVRGRFLRDDDESISATPVVVIGYDEWMNRFAGDANIVGRQVRLGTTMHTVIGVMPVGFAFPINHHYWIPLRDVAGEAARDDASAVTVFGRLTANATVEQARAEIEVIGSRMTLEFPATHERLRAQLQLYTRPVTGMDNPGDVSAAQTMPLFTTLLLIVICVNVAVLIYARTAVRHGEIVVRTALGASRGRVIMQLFAEALVLSLGAAAVGLSIAGFSLQKANEILASMFGGELPFWLDFQLSLTSVIYAVALAVIAAVITGVVPALRATGAQMRSGLQQLSAGGGSTQLGKTWTFLIVAQVALTVALLPVAVFQAREMFHFATVEAGFAASSYVSSVAAMEPDTRVPFGARYDDRVRELTRALREERSVSDVTFASVVPGKEQYAEIEVETRAPSVEPSESPVGERRTAAARFTRVDPSFFSVFDVALLAGRTFNVSDADSVATAIVVNQSFVRRNFANGGALGMRIRRVLQDNEGGNVAGASKQPWYQIVGVVADFPVAMIPEQIESKVYQAGTPATMYPATLFARLRPASDANVGARLRRIAAGVDPSLEMRSIETLQSVYDDDQSVLRLVGIGIAVVTLSVLLLSSAGIYAMMSLAVTRRRREIGIRAALGANSRHILTRIFARSGAQLGTGMAFGLLVAIAGDAFALRGSLVRDPAVVGGVLLIVALVGVLASLGPARRGLQIQPAEALKQD